MRLDDAKRNEDLGATSDIDPSANSSPVGSFFGVP